MESVIARFKKELDKLVAEGELLRCQMALDLGLWDEQARKKLKSLNLPSFKENYERWYSLSLRIVKQLLPDRTEDYIKQYKVEKRKQTDFLNYGVSDYMIGLLTTRGTQVIADGKSAFPKFEQQLNILKSCQARFDSVLYDMVEIVQAQVFDNELEAAKELNSKGFVRGAGAMAGVVLERHLSSICRKRNVQVGKKKPTINTVNEALKEAGSIDIVTWRFIQHLADIRNLCDHSAAKEPDQKQIEDMIVGVAKIIKTLV